MTTTYASGATAAPTPADSQVRRPDEPRRRRRGSTTPYVLVLPAVVLVLVFAGYPLVRSVWFALNDVSPFSGQMDFVGLDNLAGVISSPGFGATLGRTAFWVFGAVSLQFLGGLSLALLLNNRFPLRGVYRGLIMVPWATPSVLVALMWKWILDPNNGVLNQGLLSLGVVDRPVEFFSQSSTALPALVMIDVWQGIPLFAIMILAALQGVSPDLKEAAAIDGCGRTRVFQHVVLPAILPTILITAVLRLIWTANYIDLIYILTGGGPANASTTLALESYLTTYKATDFGGGASYALLQAVALAVLIAVYLRLTSQKGRHA